mmetsp:Transcript_3951/g.8923  ORF Transcript_3951/g.8923 Transcript_3951/m.8923 type:complete len:88 (+) Transcript_3951:91-354(+)
MVHSFLHSFNGVYSFIAVTRRERTFGQQTNKQMYETDRYGAAETRQDTTIQNNAMLCNAMQHNTTQRNATINATYIPFHSILFHPWG